jgi:23S rRNA (uracil1939-C5)-methyltransferase
MWYNERMTDITLTLTDMAHGGSALGRHEGKVIFVPYALPGERVRVEIVEDHDRYAHARLVEILEPSPDRTSPACTYCGPQGCGGCQWQHIRYEAQLRYKTEIVADQLTRIGRFTDPVVHPTLPDPTGWAYRNRARLRPAPGGGLGFLSGASDRVVPVEACPILHPLLAELYDSLDLDVPGMEALTLRAGVNTGDRMLIFEMEDEEEAPALVTDIPVSCVLLLPENVYVNLVGRNYIEEIVAGYTFRISAPSFFQANTGQAEELVRLVLEYLEPKGNETVVDGYAGVGLFTLPLADRTGLVMAVELEPSAATDLLENTAEVQNVDVIEGPVDAFLADLDEPVDAVVVDPPRTGLEREAVKALVDARPERVIYVSCDPATLARDGQQLAKAGYRLVEVQPVDMFPQTYHIETVSLWRR